MFDISLISGRVLSVGSVHVSGTYAGVIEGKPDAAMSARLIESASTEMVRVWGRRPTYVVKSAGEPGAPLPERLPPECWCAWLKSGPVHDGDAFGSHLVVVWFRDAGDALSLRDIITAGVRAVPWESLAEDYEI